MHVDGSFMLTRIMHGCQGALPVCLCSASGFGGMVPLLSRVLMNAWRRKSGSNNYVHAAVASQQLYFLRFRKDRGS